MSNRLLILLIAFLPVFMGCEKDQALPTSLANYIADNDDRTFSSELIACAAGMPDGFMGDEAHPTSVFFYPVTGATEFRYWETDGPDYDIEDYDAFIFKDLDDEAVFNGKLWRFKNSGFSGERWGIVTYKTEGKLHVCRAIRLKTNPKPTQVAPELMQVTENGVTPSFTWDDGLYDDNVIYFQVISDTLGNIVSGTYTVDKNWQFYDLSNVVLNVHDVDPQPSLQPNETYVFTLMSVSYDNWVNLMGEKRFTTQ